MFGTPNVTALQKHRKKTPSEHVVAALFSLYRCELYFSCIYQIFLVETLSEQGSFQTKAHSWVKHLKQN